MNVEARRRRVMIGAIKAGLKMNRMIVLMSLMFLTRPFGGFAADSFGPARFGGDLRNAPFSFVYDGRSSRESSGRFESRDSAAAPDPASKRIVRFDRTTGLEVEFTSTEYKDIPAFEWVLRFTNRGDRATPILEGVNAADLALFQRVEGAVVLRYAEGSTSKPTDFRPYEAELAEDSRFVVGPKRGRSSDGMMPYFHVIRSESSSASYAPSGVVLGIGWSGQWKAEFVREADGGVRFNAGMERMRLSLRPGESVRSPSILVMYHSGDRAAGWNAWRRLMLKHFTPRASGKPVALPIAASGAAIPFERFSEANQIAAIANIASKKLPIDTWWVDAGWSAGVFPAGIGDLDADPIRFPRGLRPVADAAHSAGLKFLLWFEPERVMPGTQMFKRHPDWTLAPGGLVPPYVDRSSWRVLDLSNPDAAAFLKRHYSHRIREWGVDIYRNDFNTPPHFHWWNDEPADRIGLREIRHVEGIYEFFDTLMRENPGLVIDNCTAGGRRLDFEMTRRSVVLWRSDHCWDPTPTQCMQYGLSFWLPLHGMGAISVDPYKFRSGYASGASYALNFYDANADFWVPLSNLIQEYRSIRDLFSKDFYPLTPYTQASDAWTACQYHDSETGRGVIQAFRRSDAADETRRLRPRALDPQAVYVVRDLDTPSEPREVAGRLLVDDGWNVTIARKPGAAVLVYQKK